jgi:hypothetical protein
MKYHVVQTDHLSRKKYFSIKEDLISWQTHCMQHIRVNGSISLIDIIKLGR